MTSTKPASFALTVTAVALASATLPFTVTGAAVALPSLAADLDASTGATQWVLNAFNVAFGAFPLAAGSLADRIGHRRVLLAGVALVGAMAFVIAAVREIVVIDVARFLQGAGAAAVLASGAAVLAHATSGRERRLAFGALGAAFGAGLALGPLLAGALVELAGWPAVFTFAGVLSLVAWVCARSTPATPRPAAAPFDVAGLVVFSAALGCLALVFVEAAGRGWGSAATLGTSAATLLLLGAFVAIEVRRGERAMFDVRLFRRPDFVAVVCQPFTVTLGFVILLVYLPAYLQGVGERGSLASGMLLLPLTVPVLLVPFLGSWLAARTSIRVVLTAASLLTAAAALLLVTLQPGASWAALALPLLPFGLGVGLAFGVMDNAAVSAVPLELAGVASGIFNTMRIAGESVAVAGAAALLSTLVAGELGAHGVPGARQVAAAAVQGDVAAAHRNVLATGFTDALHVAGLVLAVLSAAGAALTWRALRPKAEPRTAPPVAAGPIAPPRSRRSRG